MCLDDDLELEQLSPSEMHTSNNTEVVGKVEQRGYLGRGRVREGMESSQNIATRPPAYAPPPQPRRKMMLDDDLPSAQVNMFGGSSALGLNPALMLLRDLEIPKFSGNLEDYVDWKQGKKITWTFWE